MFQKKGVGTRRLKSRGFAARDGPAVKSHSTTTQYRQLRSLQNGIVKRKVDLSQVKCLTVKLNVVTYFDFGGDGTPQPRMLARKVLGSCEDLSSNYGTPPPVCKTKCHVTNEAG